MRPGRLALVALLIAAIALPADARQGRGHRSGRRARHHRAHGGKAGALRMDSLAPEAGLGLPRGADRNYDGVEDAPEPEVFPPLVDEE